LMGLALARRVRDGGVDDDGDDEGEEGGEEHRLAKLILAGRLRRRRRFARAAMLREAA
jgi:hypothetical protein